MGTYSAIDYALYIGILIFVYYWIFLKFILPRIKFDRKFLFAIAPYILVGILIRVLVDVDVFQKSKFWSITPGVYVVTFLAAISLILIGKLISKIRKIDYWIFPFFAGSLTSIFLFSLLLPYFTFPLRFFYPLMLSFFITFLIYIISRSGKILIFQKIENLLIIFAHLLDANATFIAYNFYGFGEEHLLPKYLFNLVGENAIIMIPVKLSLILAVIYLIEKYNNFGEENKPLKLLLFILGFGPGLRDAILPSLLL